MLLLFTRLDQLTVIIHVQRQHPTQLLCSVCVWTECMSNIRNYAYATKTNLVRAWLRRAIINLTDMTSTLGAPHYSGHLQSAFTLSGQKVCRWYSPRTCPQKTVLPITLSLSLYIHRNTTPGTCKCPSSGFMKHPSRWCAGNKTEERGNNF